MVYTVQTLIVVGDLNILKINWSVGSSGDSIGKLLVNTRSKVAC